MAKLEGDAAAIFAELIKRIEARDRDQLTALIEELYAQFPVKEHRGTTRPIHHRELSAACELMHNARSNQIYRYHHGVRSPARDTMTLLEALRDGVLTVAEVKAPGPKRSNRHIPKGEFEIDEGLVDPPKAEVMRASRHLRLCLEILIDEGDFTDEERQLMRVAIDLMTRMRAHEGAPP